MKYKKYENYYFKAGHNLISGINPPRQDAQFKDCEFHANIKLDEFENCIFINCYFQSKSETINTTVV